MKSFEKIDAWRVCHQFVLATWKATTPLLQTERELAHRLRYVTMRAAGRIAFGSGSGDARMFRTAIWRADGYVSEAGYLLDLLHVMSLLPEEAWQDLDGLRGRTSFYLSKLVMEGFKLPGDLFDDLGDLDDGEEWHK